MSNDVFISLFSQFHLKNFKSTLKLIFDDDTLASFKNDTIKKENKSQILT
mgnify:CR=1 FL=1